MLVAQAIPALLGQVLGDGVHTALLMQHDGSVLGSKSVTESAQDEIEEANLSTAIEAGVLWETYSQVTQPLPQPHSLRCVAVECEGRRLCVVEISQLLLCIVSDLSVGIGMLRRKASVLAAHLKVHNMSQLCPSIKAHLILHHGDGFQNNKKSEVVEELKWRQRVRNAIQKQQQKLTPVSSISKFDCQLMAANRIQKSREITTMLGKELFPNTKSEPTAECDSKKETVTSMATTCLYNTAEALHTGSHSSLHDVLDYVHNKRENPTVTKPPPETILRSGVKKHRRVIKRKKSPYEVGKSPGWVALSEYSDFDEKTTSSGIRIPLDIERIKNISQSQSLHTNTNDCNATESIEQQITYSSELLLRAEAMNFSSTDQDGISSEFITSANEF